MVSIYQNTLVYKDGGVRRTTGLTNFYLQGQEYAKPKNFNKEENSSNGRGSNRVKPGRELYRPPVNNWNIDGTFLWLYYLPIINE